MAVGADTDREAERFGALAPIGLTAWLGLGLAGAAAFVAYLCFGAPGLSGFLPPDLSAAFDVQQTWIVGVHLLATAAALSGGVWLTSALREMDMPGLAPQALVVALQPLLLLSALANFAMAASVLTFEGWTSAGAFSFWTLLAIGALRVHMDMYLVLLRQSGWSRVTTAQAGGGFGALLRGAFLMTLTLACNLAPLALLFQSLTTHLSVMVSVLYRRAAVMPDWYLQTIWLQASDVTPREFMLTALALGVSALLAVLWSARRSVVAGRAVASARLEGQLTPAQRGFLADAWPAAQHALLARASRPRFAAWTFFWLLIVTPALIAAAYVAFMGFDHYVELAARSWAPVPTSDFDVFSVVDPGVARYLLPAALALAPFMLARPMARLFLGGARFDRLAFEGQGMMRLRARLVRAIASDEAGPGRSFDPDQFVVQAAHPRDWPAILFAVALSLSAAAVTVWELGKPTLFTGDGIVVRDNVFAPVRLIRYDAVQAASVGCAATRSGFARPVYELILPGPRIVDMVGGGRLDARLDQYLNVDKRLRFSGVGYAYLPGDMEQCLKGIEAQYNPVIAAGAGRLLHALD